MRKSQNTEEQIADALRQAEAGTAPAKACRKLGISEQTSYRCKMTDGGIGVSGFHEPAFKSVRDEPARSVTMTCSIVHRFSAIDLPLSRPG